MEACTIRSEVLLLCDAGKEVWPGGHCAIPDTQTCKPPWKVKVVTIIWAGLCACYQIAYYLYNAEAKRRLEKLPYGRYRTGHALLAWQVGAHSQITLPLYAVCLLLALGDTGNLS